MQFNEEGNILTFNRCDTCYIYFLLQGNEVVYVGQTSNGISRPFYHHDKEYDSIKILSGISFNDLDKTEDYFIHKYKPKYNKIRNHNVIYSLKRVKNHIKNYYDPEFTLWDLRKVMAQLKMNSFRDEYTNCECISIEQFGEILNYMEAKK